MFIRIGFIVSWMQASRIVCANFIPFEIILDVELAWSISLLFFHDLRFLVTIALSTSVRLALCHLAFGKASQTVWIV